MFLMDTGSLDMRSPGSDIEITEEDAGQKNADMESAKQIWAEMAERRKSTTTAVAPTKGYTQKNSSADQNQLTSKKTGRNDKCPCGSEKKYKKCCMNKLQNI